MPAFRKDDKSSPSNYRPISLLSCIGKVMERAVYKYTNNYIVEHSLLYAYQSGFINGHSTEYQCIKVYVKIWTKDCQLFKKFVIFQKLLTEFGMRGLLKTKIVWNIGRPFGLV